MLSEAEMKEFFQRVVDEVAQLSTQAARVDSLQQQVSDLYSRVNSLEQENARLASELAHANDTVARTQREQEHVASQLESERNAVSTLRETIYQRDTLVNNLETTLGQEKDAHKITVSERDDARQAIEELRVANGRLNDLLDTTTTDRNSWRDKAIDLEAKVSDLNQRLDRVNSILNPIRAVPSADVA